MSHAIALLLSVLLAAPAPLTSDCADEYLTSPVPAPRTVRRAPPPPEVCEDDEGEECVGGEDDEGEECECG